MRRLLLVLAVVSMVGVAVATGVSWVLQASASGWTFYTPYSTGPTGWVVAVLEGCAVAYRVLVMVGAVSLAGYLVMLERAVGVRARERG